MKLLKTLSAASIALGVTFVFFAGPAAAAPPATSAAALGASTAQSLATTVQWRGRRHWRGRHWRGHRHGYRRGYGGAGAIAGLAAGAIIGGAIAAQSAARADGSIQYCIDRFQSYDVNSQTYLGYDGLRHSCP